MADTPHRLPRDLICALRNYQVTPTRFILTIEIATQNLRLFQQAKAASTHARFARYKFRRNCIISSSLYGVGQLTNSLQTPLGLHRVARKIGGGQPIGTVFRGRQPIGYVWQGLPNGSIVHRILWLEGLEPGFNRGGNVDTFNRYIYIHGFGDETTLGRPFSRGCIHVGASDLIPLFDLLPVGSLVWIGKK